ERGLAAAAGARGLARTDLRPPFVASTAPRDEPRVRRQRCGLEDVDGVEPSIATPARAPTDAAHILFTSGSTGLPKGVVVTHANVIAFVEWARPYFGIHRGDRVSGHSPLHFDLSTFDVFGALSAGAELHL